MTTPEALPAELATRMEVAPRVDLGVVRADRPAELVAHATEAANSLASVIESRKLYSNIQGKKFVRCEGWTTLAAMLGVTPHEISVTEVEGAFTATVELRRLTDGQPVSRASAECGPDESTWKNRARYARRSMALTRATAKACRLAFSWIMALSGYEVTPAEEIPQDERPRRGVPAGNPESKGVDVGLEEPPKALTEKPEPLPSDPVADENGEEFGEILDPAEELRLFTAAKKAGITKATWGAFYEGACGRKWPGNIHVEDVKRLEAALPEKKP